MKWSGAHLGQLSRPSVTAGRPRPARVLTALASFSVVLAVTTVPAPEASATPVTAPAGSASPVLDRTTSYYERSANPGRLFRQGERAGRADAQGIVILDFGRPADDGLSYGTLGYRGAFISMAAIKAGVENYVRGYFRAAPSYTKLDVAIGTNNSCGPGQPCGGVICGCPDEPPDLYIWGQQLALAVMTVGSWAADLKARDGYTDIVNVVAADDAEPAYDPGFTNTYNLLDGYAHTVGGTVPAMVDYGSAEADYWTEPQLFQVAYGFPPDVPMPQVYYAPDATDWARLLRYAKARRGETLSIYGVLTGGPGTNDPQVAYADMLSAASAITDQHSIPWLSTIDLGPATAQP